MMCQYNSENFIFTNLMFTNTLHGGCIYYPDFTKEETKAREFKSSAQSQTARIQIQAA